MYPYHRQSRMTEEERRQHELIRSQVRRQVCKAGRLLKKHCGFYYKSGQSANRTLSENRAMHVVTTGGDRHNALEDYTKLFLEEWTPKTYAKFVVGVVTPPWYAPNFDLEKSLYTLEEAKREVAKYLDDCYIVYDMVNIGEDYYGCQVTDNMFYINDLKEEIKTAALLSRKPRTF